MFYMFLQTYLYSYMFPHVPVRTSKCVCVCVCIYKYITHVRLMSKEMKVCPAPPWMQKGYCMHSVHVYLCVQGPSVHAHACNEGPLPRGCQHICLIDNPAVSPQCSGAQGFGALALLNVFQRCSHASGQLACKPKAGMCLRPVIPTVRPPRSARQLQPHTSASGM